MGCLCCCWPGSEEFEGYALHSSRGACQHCICFSCCWTRLFCTHAFILQPAEGNDSSSVVQGESGSASDELLVVTSSDSPPHIYHAPPNPLPYDIDQRYPRQPREVCAKSGNSPANISEDEPRTTDGDCVLTTSPVDSGIDSDEREGVKPGISRKMLPSKATGKVEVKVAPVDDEDVCPTCFDGYNEENPKISTACGHHFHLSCIYEWMERSIHCPVCYKEMVFSETP